MIRCVAFLACLGLSGTGAVAHEAHLKQLRVVHPYTLAATSGSLSSASILMTIVNAGEDDDLVGVTTKLSKTARLMNGSERIEKIRIGARSETELSKTGLRIEIEGLKEELVAYQTFPVMLEFERAGRIKVDVLVEDPADQPAEHHN